MARVLVNVPKTVAKGEPFDVKVIISHPMESGQRYGPSGETIPAQDHQQVRLRAGRRGSA